MGSASRYLVVVAAFAVAHSRSFEPVVEAYLDAYPEEREKYEAYQQLDKEIRNPDPSDQFARMFDLAPPPTPEEIRGSGGPGLS